MLQIIDPASWPRRNTFAEFMELDCSFALTRSLSVSAFLRHLRDNGLRFYPSFTWAATAAVNAHREFRMGLDEEGRPGYYDVVHPEYTVLDPRTRNMDSLNTPFDREFSRFYAAMSGDLDRFRLEGVHTPSRENSILLSCVPWYSYTGLSFHMKSSRSFLRPMLIWGKYEEREGDASLPFTIQVHHAAADGYHCHLLFQTLEEILEHPEQFLA